MLFSALKKPAVGLVVVALLLAMSIPLQRAIEGIRGRSSVIEGTLYMSSSALDKIALGYNEILSDIYWIRALQYFGDKRNAEKNPYQLYRYFDIMTDLDPRFVNAYRYGGTFLAEVPPIGMGEPHMGIRLFDKGRMANPDNFRLPLEEAFIAFLYLKDYDMAADLFYEASTKPNLSDMRRASLKGMAAVARSRVGDRGLARKIWRYIYENTESESRKKWALKNINELDTRDVEGRLTKALREYQSRYGSLPRTVQGLKEAGFISKVPIDPSGGNFVIAPKIVAVKSDALAREELKSATGFLTSRAQMFKSAYGRYPKDMAELKGFVTLDVTKEFPKHPFGEEYEYDPETGRVGYRGLKPSRPE